MVSHNNNESFDNKHIIELCAKPINHLWSTRKIMRHRFTRTNNNYDADFNLIIRDQDGAGNIQLYMLDTAETEKTPCAQLEQLIRHMSRDHHQALLVLHISLQGMDCYFRKIDNYQNISAYTNHSCPLMGLMPAMSAPPQNPAHRWPVGELKRNGLCGLCYVHELNDWNSCMRRQALLNLHPGMISRPRQMLYLILQVLKYLPIPNGYVGPIFRFIGNVPYGPIKVQDPSRNPTIPTEIHNAKIICYGESFYSYLAALKLRFYCFVNRDMI